MCVVHLLLFIFKWYFMFEVKDVRLTNPSELKKEDIKIKKEQLELVRRQFRLDSIAMEQNKNVR